MNARQLLSEFRQTLLRRPITFIRLAANSLLLYVDCQPGDEFGFTIWFEPVWHMSSAKGVMVDSRQAQGKPNQGATEEELNKIGSPLNVLISLPITAIESDSRTNDLMLTIGSEYLVRTFVTDPTDNHSWHISDHAKRLKVYGFSGGLRISEIQRRTKGHS